MAPESFTLSECTVADVPGMIQVYNTSFASDYMNQYTFPRSAIGDDEINRWLSTRFTNLFSKREVRTFKITEEHSGKLVAFLRWAFPHVLTDEEKAERAKEKAEREKMREETGKDPNWPMGANLEVCDEKFGGLERFKEKYVDETETYGMSPPLHSQSLQPDTLELPAKYENNTNTWQLQIS